VLDTDNTGGHAQNPTEFVLIERNQCVGTIGLTEHRTHLRPGLPFSASCLWKPAGSTTSQNVTFDGNHQVGGKEMPASLVMLLIVGLKTLGVVTIAIVGELPAGD
jgi:hypothetical protein